MEVTCFRDKQNDITHDVTPENYQKYANWAKNVQLETQRVALETIKAHVELDQKCVYFWWIWS